MHLISIIIPCRNEERYIERCLQGVLEFVTPDDIEIEVFVMDGRSTDRTAALVTQIALRDSRVKLRENPGRIQSTAMNLALDEVCGEWIMRLDAHSFYPKDYLQLCLETAQKTGADNVGGLFITLPGGEDYGASLVQALTTHKFGVGDSGFRIGMGEGRADTVPYGFYRRELFQRVGRFDERLVRAQDYEFNRRLIAAGGAIWRNPHIQVHYHNQPTLGQFLMKQIQKEAPYNAYLWYLAPYAFAWRHSITAVFVAGVVGGVLLSPFSTWIMWPFLGVMLLYGSLALASAGQQCLRYREWRHLFALPVAFFLYHFVHGLGVWVGLGLLALGRAPVQAKPEPWPGAGVQRLNPRALTPRTQSAS